eukprot:321194_1
MAKQQRNKTKPLPTDELTQKDIIKFIPKQCFEKDLSTSLYYMIRDLSILMTAFWTYQYLNLIVFYNIYGFVMWCIFVVGHDCGHTTFSDSDLINGICGHICHSILCVPFWPWAYSHSIHHRYHNHFDKDRSHPHYDRKECKYDSIIEEKFWHNNFITPLYAFFAYLFLGLHDGSHVWPYSKLFAGQKK